MNTAIFAGCIVAAVCGRVIGEAFLTYFALIFAGLVTYRQIMDEIAVAGDRDGE